MREGVADFVFKGNLSRLIPTIHRELATAAQQVARREADQRFRDIVEVSGDWIWETDAEHRYTFFSNRFQDGKGADPAASLGKTRWELAGVDPEEDEDWQAHLADLSARRPFRNFLFSYVDLSGSRRHVSTSGVPVFDRSGAFCGYRGTATDETRIVEAFWRAEEAETLLRDAVESISEGFLILDRDDRIVMANDALSQTLSRRRGTLRAGMPVRGRPARRPRAQRLSGCQGARGRMARQPPRGSSRPERWDHREACGWALGAGHRAAG